VDHFRQSDGLSDDTVERFYEDREGNIRVATPQGLDRFRDVAVTTLSRREGLTADHASAVLVSRSGTVWTSNRDTLNSIRDGKVSATTFPGQQLASLLKDHTGKIWVGVDAELFVLDEGLRAEANRQAGTKPPRKRPPPGKGPPRPRPAP